MSLSFCSMFPFSTDADRPASLTEATGKAAQVPDSAMQAPPLNAVSPFGMPFSPIQAGDQEPSAAVSAVDFPFAAASATSLFQAAPLIDPLDSSSVLLTPKARETPLPFAAVCADEGSVPVSPFAPSAAGFAQTGETSSNLAAAGLKGILPFGMADLAAARADSAFGVPLMPLAPPTQVLAFGSLTSSPSGGFTGHLASTRPLEPQLAGPLLPTLTSPQVVIRRHAANPDQMLLRALLDTDAELCSQKIVEGVCRLPGIAACVCLHSGGSVSHINAHNPLAREFQKQATELATHLRILTPLIGMKDAEAFMIHAGDRIMTFCFPGDTIFAVLHDAEPMLSQRDKITLIAREMAKMHK